MSTYNAILDTQLDPDSPGTSVLMYQLRDNPLAIAEADSSVPDALLPTVLLGTVTLTGTSVSLTGLNLEPYKFLRLAYYNVDPGTTGSYFYIVGNSGGSLGDGLRLCSAASAAGVTFDGTAEIQLLQGIGSSVSSESVSADGNCNANRTNIRNSNTALYFIGSNFGSGTVYVYGCK